MTPQLIPEMKVLFPFVEEASFSHTCIMSTDSMKLDTVVLVYLKSREQVSKTEHEKIKAWLSARVDSKNIKLLIE